MKKKLLVMLCLAAVLVSCLAFSVSAAGTAPEDYICQCCGKTYAACNWQPWTLTNGGTANTLTADGHYYLTADVPSITGQIRIGDSVASPKITLDLRGFTMTSSQRVFGVYPSAVLSIVDTVGGGMITGKQVGNSQVGGTIRVNEGATLNLFGGTVLDGATKEHAANGAAISTEGKYATINIDGATVIGTTYAPYGGAINATSGATVNIKSGTVTGGSATYGGAICVRSSTLNISGGTINGGSASYGGAIYGSDGVTINISGGIINGGAASKSGGAIYASNNTNIQISGGTINGGSAADGGAIAMLQSSLTMSDGIINGGAVSGFGSAIHLFKDSAEVAVPCSVEVNGGTINVAPGCTASAISMAANSHTVTINGGTFTGATTAAARTGSVFSTYGTGAHITINGGTFTGAADENATASGLIYSRGILTINGGEFVVTGDGPVASMYENYGKLTMNAETTKQLSGKIKLTASNCMRNGFALLTTQDGHVAGRWYNTLTEALANYGDAYFLRPMTGATLDLEGKTVALDVNGCVITVKNGAFYGMDTANDSFKSSKCGTVKMDATATCLNSGSYTAPNGYSYLAMESINTYSFHRYHMAIDYVTLQTEVGREGIYYSSYFAGDDVIHAYLVNFGIALSKQDLQTPQAWAEAMSNGTAAYSMFSNSEFEAGVAPEKQTLKNGTLLKNIINNSNDDETNQNNANTVIYGVPYLLTADGTYLLGQQQQTRLSDVLAYTDQNYDSLTEAQMAGLLLMYERYTSSMNALGMANVRANYDSDIIAARRYTVLKEMLDQKNILWRVDQEVPYSFHSSSKGYEADRDAEQEAGKSFLSDDLGVFYPDRIYRGLPYTHAATGNDALQILGEKDENGVYVLKNASTVLFNGGSNGTGTYGAANTARIGNDCWDAVYWSWSRISTTAKADQTNQMTPDFGVLIVGQDILEAKMKELGTISADQSILDYICTPSTASGTKGMRVYKAIPDTEPNGTIDGTRLVRYGTRTGEKAIDHQALYQTYAMLQKGDAMVRWANGAGHAIMVISVDVVYTSAGLIDPDKSTITIVEQGSGHEERQARLESEFSTYYTGKHDTHTGTSYNKNCMYCAGYTDEIIDGMHVWQLDYDPRAETFTSIMEGDYIGVTCQELQDNSMAAQPVISDKTFNNISNVYVGNIASNYAISSITLEIRDTEGNLVHTSSAINVQSGVRNPFDLSRWSKDAGYGVLQGDVIFKKSGTKLTTDVLPAGNYIYTFTATLGTKQKLVFRTGNFTVSDAGVAF